VVEPPDRSRAERADAGTHPGPPSRL